MDGKEIEFLKALDSVDTMINPVRVVRAGRELR